MGVIQPSAHACAHASKGEEVTGVYDDEIDLAHTHILSYA